jgi:hypothetical protein
LFAALRRQNSSLTKPPATAELLDWLVAMLAVETRPDKRLREQSDRLFATLTALIKHEADLDLARALAQSWVDQKKAAAAS